METSVPVNNCDKYEQQPIIYCIYIQRRSYTRLEGSTVNTPHVCFAARFEQATTLFHTTTKC